VADLVVRGLGKSFGGQPALADVSFAARDGEFCILLGPSGCGKSTTLRIVAGLERQDRGEVLVGGREVSELSPRERDVAMVFQSYALYPHMDVRANLAFALRMRRTPADEIERRVLAAARLLGIEPLLGRRARELSGGQRQRVAIGRAIVRQPRLFLFDEPLSNLDAQLRATTRIELARLHRQLGTTMVYVTHDQVEAMTLGSRIVVFDRGTVQQVGTPREIYEAPANLFVAGFVGSPRINTLAGTVALRAGGAEFRAGDLVLPLPAGRGYEGCAGAGAVVAVRPEALAPGEGPVRGTVEFVEDLGAEVVLYAGVGGARWAARLPPGTRAAAGEAVSLTVNPAGLHLFRDGARVGAEPG
jgi:ABC-type sugar transport system ATPase subunit